MKHRGRLIALLALYWIIFFVVARALFLLYHGHQLSILTFIDIITVFVLGLRMDAAMTGYWLLLPCLILSIPAIPARWIFYFINTITIVLLVVSVVIVTVDLELYSHWGFRMNTTPLFYIGSEAVGSVNPRALISLIIILVVLLGGFIFLYLRWISPKILLLEPLKKRRVPIMLLITATLIIPIRSSFTVAPLNTGVVYFHKTLAFPNHAGINVTWNFFKSLSKQSKITYPNGFYADGDPNVVVDELTQTQGNAIELLKSPRPNVILIIMESFTAKIIEPLGGMKDITPELNKLAGEGMLFDNIYASGDRTDKGLVSILSGFPSQPLTSIIKYPEKTMRLSYLPRSLQELGYHTSFVYGGDIGFANMESYVTMAGFSHITSDDEFEGFNFTKWGVPDQYVFDRLRQECDTASSPFFKVMLSLSSHEPFDVPGEVAIPGNDERSMFLNSCHYSDKSLGEFIRQAKESTWWNNTLVIITADHGHHWPDQAQELQEKMRFKIPLLLLGGALAKADTVIHTLGGQTDIANSVLSQIGQAKPSFRFSKNLLGIKTNPFAVYVFHNGYGFIDPNGETIYDFDYQNFVKQEGDPANIPKGKAYMQALFNDYNSY